MTTLSAELQADLDRELSRVGPDAASVKMLRRALEQAKQQEALLAAGGTDREPQRFEARGFRKRPSQ